MAQTSNSISTTTRNGHGILENPAVVICPDIEDFSFVVNDACTTCSAAL